MHEEGRTWEVVPLFKWITSALPPQSPGWLAYSPSAQRKEEARRAADTPGFFAFHPRKRAERWEKFPTRPEVELNDSRKAGGRASGGLGAAPPVMRTGGVVASPRRNSPYPKKAPAPPAQRGLFSSHGPRKRF